MRIGVGASDWRPPGALARAAKQFMSEHTCKVVVNGVIAVVGLPLISRAVHDGLVPQPRADSLPAAALQWSSTLVPLYRQWMQKSQSETTLAPLR
jgi:hypothetical protein